MQGCIYLGQKKNTLKMVYKWSQSNLYLSYSYQWISVNRTPTMQKNLTCFLIQIEYMSAHEHNLVKIFILHKNEQRTGRQRPASACACAGWHWSFLFALKKSLSLAQWALVILFRIKKFVFLTDVLNVTTHWAASSFAWRKKDIIIYNTCHQDAKFNAIFADIIKPICGSQNEV